MRHDVAEFHPHDCSLQLVPRRKWHASSIPLVEQSLKPDSFERPPVRFLNYGKSISYFDKSIRCLASQLARVLEVRVDTLQKARHRDHTSQRTKTFYSGG